MAIARALDLNRTQGITIVLVTHSDEIASYEERIIGSMGALSATRRSSTTDRRPA